MKNELARMLSKRTQIVWGSFFAVMSTMLVLLQVGSSEMQEGGVLLVNISSMNERPEQDPIFSGEVSDHRATWSGIVVQHLGEPAGSIESIHRSHVAGGLDGLVFHFVIGNGNGLGDGAVHASERWLNQTKSARPIYVPRIVGMRMSSQSVWLVMGTAALSQNDKFYIFLGLYSDCNTNFQ